MAQDQVTVSASLSDGEAMALAQFVKRIGRDDCRRLAGDQAEADAMFEALIVVREGLREAGYAPR